MWRFATRYSWPAWSLETATEINLGLSGTQTQDLSSHAIFRILLLLGGFLFLPEV